MNPCPECHHAPSGRTFALWGRCLTCECRCHDVADASPELLVACNKTLRFLVALGISDQLILAIDRLFQVPAANKGAAILSVQRTLADAIAKAEGEPSWLEHGIAKAEGGAK